VTRYLNAAICLVSVACAPPPPPNESVAPPLPRRYDAGEPSSADDAAIEEMRDASTQEIDAAHEPDASSPESFAPVFGVTLTDPWSATGSSRVADELRALEGSRPPLARVVFDSGVDRVRPAYDIDSSAYAEPLRAIGASARVMGELLDSFFMPQYSIAEFRARACEYRAELGHLVDVWEIGNEVNGEWLGADVAEKLAAAIDVFSADRGGFTDLCPGLELQAEERDFELALTLYYNGGHDGGVASVRNCWADPEHAMVHWTSAQFAEGGPLAAYRERLDYVWVSFYEDDCHGHQPEWQSVFDELASIFEHARLGIGECGTDIESEKPRYVERYYEGMESSEPSFANMRVDHPRFVGGYFWWYWSDDLDDERVGEGLRRSLGNAFWSR
jgi:hypothetical protein